MGRRTSRVEGGEGMSRIEALKELALLSIFQGIQHVNLGREPYDYKGEEAGDLVQLNILAVEKLNRVDSKINRLEYEQNKLAEMILKEKPYQEKLLTELKQVRNPAPDKNGIIRNLTESQLSEKLSDLKSEMKGFGKRLDSYESITEEIKTTRRNLKIAQEYYDLVSGRSLLRLETLKDKTNHKQLKEMQDIIRKLRTLAGDM
jgi:hypothetical protein